MIHYRYGKRLDEIDYESMGYESRWIFRSAVILLTSFEMETKKYYERQDINRVYPRLYDRYFDYIKNMVSVISIDSQVVDDYAIDFDRTNFAKEDALNHFKTNNTLKIDMPLLEQYLNGNAAKIVDTQNTQKVLEDQLTYSIIGYSVESNSDTNNECTSSNELSSDEHNNKDQYRFEKTTQSWNIYFGNIELIGVKDLVGMDYIATLLKKPGTPIGVIQIQAMLNPVCVSSSGSSQRGDLEDQDEPSIFMNDKSVRSSKSISMENLKRRLRELSQRRNELDSDYDHIELEEIDNEYATIEAEIDNIQYSRNDDPEIKKNRDKVAKAIKAAIENIRGLKTKKGESSVPICNFLTQHIKTASECIYNPPTINPPNWSF